LVAEGRHDVWESPLNLRAVNVVNSNRHQPRRLLFGDEVCGRKER
jgi:hypothetical protein